MREFSDIFAELDKDLSVVDKIILDFAKGKSPLIAEISNHLVSSGGKRIRPILHLLVAKLCQGQAKSYNYDLAAAIELIHSATLLHDDVVDNSKSRRGKDTANAVWDNKAPILVGDFLFSLAFQLMTRTNNLEVLDLLAKTSSIMADGEVMQLENSNDVTLSQDKYLEIIYGKTAVLFEATCKSAAILAQKTPQDLIIFSQFGKNLGTLFQIVDDILDYEANAKDLGKEIGDDFFEGKVTLPIILLFNQASDKEKDLIKDIFANNFENLDEKNHDNLAIIFDLLSKYDILAQAKKIALNYQKLALKNLEKFAGSSFYDDLVIILNYSMKRIS